MGERQGHIPNFQGSIRVKDWAGWGHAARTGGASERCLTYWQLCKIKICRHSDSQDHTHLSRQCILISESIQGNADCQVVSDGASKLLKVLKISRTDMSPEFIELFDLEIAARRRGFDERLRAGQLEASAQAKQWVQEFLLDGGDGPGRSRIFEKAHDARLKIALGAIAEWTRTAWQALLDTIESAAPGDMSESEFQSILERHISFGNLVELGQKVADPERLREELDRNLESYGLANCSSENRFEQRLQRSSSEAEIQIRHAARSARQKLGPAIKRFAMKAALTGQSEQKTGPQASKQLPRHPNSSHDCIPRAPDSEEPWVNAIRAAVREFVADHGRCPGRTELWNRLQSRPPAGYQVQSDFHLKEACLVMPGERPLGRAAFHKRWKRYTDG